MKPSTHLFTIKNPLRVLLILILSTASIATVMAQGLGPAGPSPATGHASVVSTGALAIDEDVSRWHITRHTAESAGEVFVSPVQGFIIAENTPIEVNVTGYGRAKLAGGESWSIPGNREFTVQTFGAPDTFLFMQLLGESRQQLPGSVDRILTSASFDTEIGTYDANLIRDVLAEGEEGSIFEGNTPTAVYVLVGEVEVSNPQGITNLSQGDSAIFSGEITITAIADGSTYYAGFIGAELPPLATPVPATPEPTPIPATPEPVEIPATPEPVEIPATPDPVEIPATPEPEPEPIETAPEPPASLVPESEPFTAEMCVDASLQAIGMPADTAFIQYSFVGPVASGEYVLIAQPQGGAVWGDVDSSLWISTNNPNLEPTVQTNDPTILMYAPATLPPCD